MVDKVCIQMAFFSGVCIECLNTGLNDSLEVVITIDISCDSCSGKSAALKLTLGIAEDCMECLGFDAPDRM